MDYRLELVSVPVSDIDRAKAFYVDKVGFNADHDFQVTPELRFVQLTPPGSACSIVIGTGITSMAPGSQTGLQVVVEDYVHVPWQELSLQIAIKFACALGALAAALAIGRLVFTA